MIEIAKLPADDRRELFHNTAAKIGFHDAIIEKDFWVCLTLDYLFRRSPWKSAITFKGGTSLSKGYHLISRFSEDIDQILDWRILGFDKNEPWETRSNTKQDAFNKEANRRAEVFLAETVCPQVKDGLSLELSMPVNLYRDEEDKQTVIFAYPNLFTDVSTLQVIRLEIGALAAWTPACSGKYRALCGGTVPAIIQEKRYICADSRAGAYLLGKSYNPTSRGESPGTFGDAPAVFQTLL